MAQCKTCIIYDNKHINTQRKTERILLRRERTTFATAKQFEPTTLFTTKALEPFEDQLSESIQKIRLYNFHPHKPRTPFADDDVEMGVDPEEDVPATPKPGSRTQIPVFIPPIGLASMGSPELQVRLQSIALCICPTTQFFRGKKPDSTITTKFPKRLKRPKPRMKPQREPTFLTHPTKWCRKNSSSPKCLILHAKVPAYSLPLVRIIHTHAIRTSSKKSGTGGKTSQS
jgi:hypothetical protein